MTQKLFAMKITLTLMLSMLCAATSFAQEAILKNLTPFDKVVIEGDVQELRLHNAEDENPAVRIKGISENDVSAEVLAGTLHLSIKNSKTPAEISIYNGRLKRISGTPNMNVTGAEVIGGDTGNYLVVSFNRSHGPSQWAADDSDFHIHIPDVHVEVPDMDFAVRIPDMDFGFDFDFDEHDFDFKMDIEELDEGWRHEWRYNWEDHKKELKRWSEEWSDEMKEAMKEAKEELKRMKKD